MPFTTSARRRAHADGRDLSAVVESGAVQGCADEFAGMLGFTGVYPDRRLGRQAFVRSPGFAASLRSVSPSLVPLRAFFTALCRLERTHVRGSRTRLSSRRSQGSVVPSRARCAPALSGIGAGGCANSLRCLCFEERELAETPRCMGWDPGQLCVTARLPSTRTRLPIPGLAG